VYLSDLSEYKDFHNSNNGTKSLGGTIAPTVEILDDGRMNSNVTKIKCTLRIAMTSSLLVVTI